MPTRQLAAILFADIVGYTQLIQEDEAHALSMLERLRQVMEAEALTHQGQIHELRGEGTLSSFKSTLEGVRAALAIQIAMQETPAVPLRIAIHTGDVTLDGDALYGDGVNIASRIESLALAGSILISERVYDDIRNHKEIQTVSLGRFHLRNVKDEIDLYALRHPGIYTPDSTDLEGQGEKVIQKSILVLPVINLSRDPEQDYFSDGLTEELISSLSHLKQLRVFSRTTSMKYKGSTDDIRHIGAATGATYVMEGSVRTQGKQLRITAQIVDAQQDKQLWSDTYKGTLDDIFDIQEQVASKIAEALRIQLTEDEKDTLQKRYTGNMEAYQLYLQGRFFWNRRNEDGLSIAARFFEHAIEKDPDYALAWAGLADTYNLLGEFTNLSRRELHPKAKAAANKALELDPQLAEAHISLASLLMQSEWNWTQAGKEFRTGIHLNPNYATGHHWYAEYLLFTGSADEALREIAIAVELDPVSQAIIKDQGMTYYYTRQYDKAIEKAVVALALDPDFVPVHRLLSLCYTATGRYDEAIAENQIWGQRTGNSVKTRVALAHILASAGRHDEARYLIQVVSAHETLTGNDYRGMALVYVALGDADAAFDWLDQSADRHEESLISLKVDPKLDPIRSDPRFTALVLRLGLSEDSGEW